MNAQNLYKCSIKKVNLDMISILFLIGTLFSSNFILANEENKSTEQVEKVKTMVLDEEKADLEEEKSKTLKRKLEQDHKKELIRTKLCKIYKGKFVSYYHSIFWFDLQCKRHFLASEEASQISKKHQILEVPQELIALFPLSVPYNKQGKELRLDPCKWNGRYVTYDYDKFYLVEKCQLRKFPDWATYEKYRGSLSRSEKKIFPVTKEAFLKFKRGKDMLSIFSSFKQLEVEPLDILAQEEVCPKFLGKIISFVDGLYRIKKTKEGQGCEKVRINSEKYTLEKTSKNLSFTELSSQEFISIPESRPLPKNKK